MNKQNLIYGLVFLSLIILSLFWLYRDSTTDLDVLNRQLIEQSDSLSDLQKSYDSLEKHYVQIEKELMESTDKLRYVQLKLDTITSHRIETFTEIQTRLIEIKLSLGNIPTYSSDSTSRFRFE